MKQWQDIIETATQFRHELHRQPELAWQERRTAERVRQILTDLQIPWRACADTGTVASLNPQGQGPNIALRGDMDALPINETSGKTWSSEVAGHMHACGHDGHTATLVAAAQWLKQCEAQLPGPVTLLFQPAEEGGHGAREMIKDGALEGVSEVYGWHNWPAIPAQQMACPDGVVMCGNGTFKVTVTGQGGHASQPELCRDPVLAASAINLALQQIVSRRLAPQTTAVVSVTSIMAPSEATIIPQTAVLSGSIRIRDTETRKQVNQLIEEISLHTAQSYGVSCETEITPRYEATVNHAQQAQNMRAAWESERGSEGIATATRLPIMASEDFSYYLREVPGAFALIGADDGDNHHHPCHSPYYDFNDALIPAVARLFARLVKAPLPE